MKKKKPQEPKKPKEQQDKSSKNNHITADICGYVLVKKKEQMQFIKIIK
jgi:hypothetical protein